MILLLEGVYDFDILKRYDFMIGRVLWLIYDFEKFNSLLIDFELWIEGLYF